MVWHSIWTSNVSRRVSESGDWATTFHASRGKKLEKTVVREAEKNSIKMKEIKKENKSVQCAKHFII